jgi:RNA polymerase sigma-70 factor (ECF subfamily)
MDEPVDAFAELMARVHRDDARAMAELVSLYEPDVRQAARALLGHALQSWIDPTDLVQSVHLQLLLALKRKRLAIASPEHLRSLALTLLRHRLVEQWRRRRRQARHDEEVATAGGLAQGNAATLHHMADPMQEAEYNDLVDYLFRNLRDEDRRIVAMRFQGYLTREIAAALGIEPAALRMRLSRLRKRLRPDEPNGRRD